ncbi:lactosylceramide 4-alpha-galactosyltransferase-like [Cherax quadricarinatus]|uniref:lactosylceramide 4-alpha-galactosyltransferase-like n=1 Tax=Cherax quadricarinatus TaxID=27406 RepID=UPI00387E5BB0
MCKCSRDKSSVMKMLKALLKTVLCVSVGAGLLLLVISSEVPSNKLAWLRSAVEFGNIKIQEIGKGRIDSGWTEGGRGRWAGSEVGGESWEPHLCLHYKVRKEPESQVKLTWAPPTADTIFFTQTSCSTFLTAREACAVESAAHHQPQRPVLVLMTARVITQAHPLMQVLTGMSNVRLAWLDLDQVFTEEPLRTWHHDRLWVMSEGRAASAVSDAVRVELLRRYGGTYLDLDLITLRPLPSSNNWLAREQSSQVNNAIMSFAPAHQLLQVTLVNFELMFVILTADSAWQAIVTAIPAAYDPHMCCSIGPVLLTSQLHRLCPNNITIPASVSSDQLEICGDITVWPNKLFYPIPYGYKQFQLVSIFTEGAGLGQTFFTSTVAICLHLCHSFTHKLTVSVAGDSIMKEAAVRNCPQVVEVLKRHKMHL